MREARNRYVTLHGRYVCLVVREARSRYVSLVMRLHGTALVHSVLGVLECSPSLP